MSFDPNTNSTAYTDKEKANQALDLQPEQSIHHDSSFKKGKKKQRLPDVDPTRPCFFSKLPVEVVSHVFSRLDPVSLATAAKVCTNWRHVVTDDNCWKDAFVSYFGRLPFKRLSLESWKTEYVLRTHLLRKWTKGRGTVMSFDPKIQSIESMYVDFEELSMIVGSTEHGVAAKCNPMTGKIDRHLFYSTNESVRMPITAIKVDKDRILWGFSPGYVTLSIRTKSGGPTASRLKTFSDFHAGAVQVLAFASNPDVVLSGASDGTIKMWDVSTNSCAWTLHPASASAKQPTFLKTTLDSRIIAGYDDGLIMIWNVNFSTITAVHRTSHREDYLQKQEALYEEIELNKIVIEPPASIDIRVSVKQISYDAEIGMLVVAYTEQAEVYKYDVKTGSCVGIFGGGHVAGTAVTCMKWDKAPTRSITSLESTLKSGVNLKKRGGIIDLSVSSSKTSSGRATPLSTSNSLSNAKSTRILVTGDDIGTVCLWNGDNVGQGSEVTIKPIKVLQGHVVGISCIFVDAFKIVTGSDDGWVRMWDPLTGENIATLGNKIPKKAPIDRTDMSVMRVKNIWCNDYQGVATIGHQVKTWDFSPGKQLLSRRDLKQKEKPYGIVIRDRIKFEIDREVKESVQKINSEKVEREREEREINKLTLGGLSDEEMLSYAMMLSQQEEEATVSDSQKSFVGQSDFVDDDEELMKAVIASLNMQETKQVALTTDNFYAESDCASSEITNPVEVEDWPTVSEASSSSNRSQEEEEEMDEELRYILQLSKTEK